jgi:hypothetical protein
MKRITTTILAAALALAPLAARAEGRGIIGADDEEDAPRDAGPPPPAPDKKDAKKDEKKDDKKKKGDEKKPDEKVDDKKVADDKKADDKKADDKKAGKPDAKSTPKDVLDDSDEDKKKKSAEAEKKRAAEEAAEKAAEEAAAKKSEADKKAAAEKAAAEEKRRKDTRDSRLAAAKKIRGLVRTAGSTGLGLAIEPGMPVANEVTELRLRVTKKLDVADPRFGDLQPMENLALVATVEDATGKKDAWKRSYVLHALDAPGKYGFHVTLPKDGAYRVSIDGNVDGNKVAVTYPLHVGVWPPPDFDEEEKKAQEAAGEASKGGRSIISE